MHETCGFVLHYNNLIRVSAERVMTDVLHILFHNLPGRVSV